jgi:hypothetical protein
MSTTAGREAWIVGGALVTIALLVSPRLAYAPEIAEAMLRRRQESAMVSNLMVVLTGDRAPMSVIDAGSLY